MAQIGIVRAVNDIQPWLLVITNGPTANPNVQVTFTLPAEFSISNSTIFPVGSLAGSVWTIGAMSAGEVVSANIILQFDGPVPGVAEVYTIEAEVTGTDTNGTNNIKTDTILFEIATCDPFASGEACETGLKFDLSACSTPCTNGATPEWTITPASEVNINIIDFDSTTGIGYYEFIDPSIPGSFTWGLNCILGEDTITLCSSYTMTLHPLIDDKDVFDHSADFIEGSTLTPEQIALLKAQPAYTGLTDEQIQAFCWETLYNADGDLVGGWAHACQGTQDNRSFIFCSEVECDEPVNECPSCPNTNMPLDVSDYLDSITNYTPEEGDTITIYHPGAISLYEYNGTAWVRNDCGCITFLNNAFPVSVTVTGDTTKTLTITLSDTTTLSASWTDNDTNTTYRLEPATVGDMCYVRLINNQTNTIVSSVQVACTGEDAPCCCDCDVTLIPTLDGAVAETNCADIVWTGEGANAIWESRPIEGGEGDWTALDGGEHNGVYDNGCVGCLIRVRYTINACERFSNTVEVKSCPCQVELAYTDFADTPNVFYIETQNCSSVDFDTAIWQIRTNRNVWATAQTGDSQFDFNAWSITVPGAALIATIDGGVDASIGLRLLYTDNNCSKVSNIVYVSTP